MPVDQPAANFQTRVAAKPGEDRLEVSTTWGTIRVTLENGRIAGCTLPRLDEEPANLFRLEIATAGIARASRLRERAPAEWTRPTGERLELAKAVSAGNVNPAPHSEIIRFMEAIFQGLEIEVPRIGNLPGTDFQRSVWRAMAGIPLGQTRTYGELAKAIRNPGAVRAVGSACGANPVPLFIPCHRVVATNGLGGFGSGLPWKRLLLRAEGVLV